MASAVGGMMSVAIVGAGQSTPDVIIDNEALVKRFGLRVDARWIEERTGVRARHWLRDDQTTSDLAVEAARRILEATGTDARDVDLLVLATISPDMPSPATATIAARKLGLRCSAFDVSAACSGFLYAMEIGANAILAGSKRRVLVVAADARSRYLDPSDHRSLVLFADGAAGVLLAPSSEPGVMSIKTGAEGSVRPGAWVPAGGAARPTSAATLAEKGHYLRVDPKEEIFDNAVRFTKEICEEALAAAGIGWDKVDFFVSHQGNARMVERVLDALKFPAERAMNSIEAHGNVSGATVPLALTDALAQGRIRRGDRVLLTSVGAGYTFAAAVHRFVELPAIA